MDDEINKEEMLAFFDSNMPSGKQYDRALADKIFNIFDTDKSGKISVDEFIKTFIHIEEELKSHKTQIKAKYQAELDKVEDLKKKMNFYRSENLNSEGIAPSAKLTIEIANVEFIRFKQYSAIKIRLSFDDIIESTRPITNISQNIYWNQKFEFKVEKRTYLIFDIIDVEQDGEEFIIGSVQFDLDKIDKQEDYDVTLEIPDDESSKQSAISSKINCKITFIWSYFEYYQELFNKSERNSKSYKSLLDKNNSLLDNLNEPFKNVLFEDIYAMNEIAVRETKTTIKQEEEKNNKSLDDIISFQTEKFLKDKFSKLKIIYYIRG